MPKHAHFSPTNENELSHQLLPGPRRRRSSAKISTPSLHYQMEDEDLSGMTYGRRIANTLMKYKWYNPQGGTNHDTAAAEGGAIHPLSMVGHTGRMKSMACPVHEVDLMVPRLTRAWMYFEHIVLPRYLVQDQVQKSRCCGLTWWKRMVGCESVKLERAEPGEKYKLTRLYSPLMTPLNQMGDFGLGVGLYFYSLMFLIWLMFLAGCLHIPNIIFFKSTAYSDPPQVLNDKGLIGYTLSGSAICTNTEWVPCPNCNSGEWDRSPERIQIVNATSHLLPFALKNNCDGAHLSTGLFNLGTLVFLMLGFFVMNRQIERVEVGLDEDEQTPSDYSIVVRNPPPDATNPDEWKHFFEMNFGADIVTVVTVDLDNDLLVRSLVERRERLMQIRNMVPRGTILSENNLAKIAAEKEYSRGFFGKLSALLLHPFGLAWDIPALYGRLVVVTAKIRGLAQREYPATNVFVTFETEKAQREVLSKLMVGRWAVMRNVIPHENNNKYKFRNRVLDVAEPQEPSTIRWQDLNSTFLERVKRQIVSYTLTAAAVGGLSVIMFVMRKKNAVVVSFLISALNVIFPIIAELLTKLEFHPSESSREMGLFIKIALFRWLNTAVFIQFFKPFTATIEHDRNTIIPAVYAIFFADIITSNAIQILDIFGHVQRHILGPRAATQDLMNRNFQGTPYSLAERYTNMTKILFLAVYYGVIFPQGFFLCSFALAVNYVTDKFSIMRTWAFAPRLGSSITDVAKSYFFPLIVFTYSLSSSYMWTGFPFDNLCVSQNETGVYNGSYNITVNGTHQQIVTITNDTKVFEHCTQNLWALPKMTYPALPKYQEDGHWMTEDQQKLTTIYGWASVAVLVIILIKLMFSLACSFYETWFGRYEPKGKDMGKPFSSNVFVHAYIPLVRSDEYSYPLVACRTDQMDNELFDWEDPDRPYDYYNLTKDADDLLAGDLLTRDASQVVFDRVKHWPSVHSQRNGLKSSSEEATATTVFSIHSDDTTGMNNFGLTSDRSVSSDGTNNHGKKKPAVDNMLLALMEEDESLTGMKSERSGGALDSRHRTLLRQQLGDDVWSL